MLYSIHRENTEINHDFSGLRGRNRHISFPSDHQTCDLFRRSLDERSVVTLVLLLPLSYFITESIFLVDEESKIIRSSIEDSFSFHCLIFYFIQKTLSVSIHEDNPEYYADGFVNFGIIYTFFLLGLWLAPPAIAMIGCKISLVLGSLFYL